jgi:hypothetical protein
MANLYSSLTDTQPSPGAQWVYASDQYAIYEIVPSAVPNTRAKWDRVGHAIMNSINPDYVMIRSKDGVILMVVGNTRWDAASLKQTMNRECFQVEAADVTYGVYAGTGYFGDRVDNATDLTYLGNSRKLIVDENFSHWRNFPDVMDNVGADFYMFRTRTTASSGDFEDNWDTTRGERDLGTEASKATNYNLGDIATGRYNEFPLDLPITNGSNLRMYHMKISEILKGDGTDNTTNLVTGATSQAGAETSNIYDRNGYFSQVIGAINPLMYTFMRSHDDITHAQNRLIFFAEADSFTPGGEHGLLRLVIGTGGNFDGDGNALELQAGMIVVPIAFTAKA